MHTWQDVSFSAFLIACFLPRAFCSLSHCLSQLHCGQVCLGRQAGRKEGIGSVLLQLYLVKAEWGRQAELERPA